MLVPVVCLVSNNKESRGATSGRRRATWRGRGRTTVTGDSGNKTHFLASGDRASRRCAAARGRIAGGRGLRGRQRRIVVQGTIDDVDQAALQAAHGGPGCLTLGTLFGVVRLGARLTAALGQGNDMEGTVQLPVPAVVHPEAPRPAEETAIGAAPDNAANAAADAMRGRVPISPSTRAATTTPTPLTAIRGVWSVAMICMSWVVSTAMACWTLSDLLGQLMDNQEACLHEWRCIGRDQIATVEDAGLLGQRAAVLLIGRVDLEHVPMQLVDQPRPFSQEVVPMITQDPELSTLIICGNGGQRRSLRLE